MSEWLRDTRRGCTEGVALKRIQGEALGTADLRVEEIPWGGVTAEAAGADTVQTQVSSQPVRRHHQDGGELIS